MPRMTRYYKKDPCPAIVQQISTARFAAYESAFAHTLRDDVNPHASLDMETSAIEELIGMGEDLAEISFA